MRSFGFAMLGLSIFLTVIIGVLAFLFGGMVSETLTSRMQSLSPAYSTEDDYAQIMTRMSETLPARLIARGQTISRWPEARTNLDDLTYSYDEESYTVAAFFDRNRSQGLVVIHDGKLIYERYRPGQGPGTRYTSWSVAKSISSTLVGLAIEDGYIGAVTDRIDQYVPGLEGTSYEGVSIEQALQMSSGVEFSEDYDPVIPSDVSMYMLWSLTVNRLRANDMAVSYPRAHEPGTVFNYNTAETQIPTRLIQSAVGKHPSDYLSEKIWQPLGMAYDAFWLLDRPGVLGDVGEAGTEMGGCCISFSLRDTARLGELFRLKGQWQGEQIIPADWVRAASTSPTGSHLEPGKLYPGSDVGYAYQWWTRPSGIFMAQGVHGQFIYVDPTTKLVIAKASAWPTAWDYKLEGEFYAVAEAIGEYLDQQQ